MASARFAASLAVLALSCGECGVKERFHAISNRQGGKTGAAQKTVIAEARCLARQSQTRVSPGRSFTRTKIGQWYRLGRPVVFQFGSGGDSEQSEVRGLKSVTTPWGEIEHVTHQADETKYEATYHNDCDC